MAILHFAAAASVFMDGFAAVAQHLPNPHLPDTLQHAEWQAGYAAKVQFLFNLAFGD